MTKADIVSDIHEKVNLPKRDSIEVVEVVLDAIKEELLNRRSVKISGFGNFVIRKKKARMGRNIRGNCPIPIEERWSITFKPSQILKAKLNGKFKLDAASNIEALGENKASVENVSVKNMAGSTLVNDKRKKVGR